MDSSHVLSLSPSLSPSPSPLSLSSPLPLSSLPLSPSPPSPIPSLSLSLTSAANLTWIHLGSQESGESDLKVVSPAHFKKRDQKLF